MPLCSGKEVLQKAQDGNYAVGAFNIETMEMAIAVLSAAEELKAPVILQTTPSTLKYASPAVFYGMVSALAQAHPCPIVLHLDHGNSPELCSSCQQAGYTSLMMDGSMLPFEENIRTVKKVRDSAPASISLEAELGTVGGKEDSLSVNGIQYTDPELAQQFAQRTGIDSLAIAIGTAHGFYKGEPVLDFDRLAACRKTVSIPLVLHGASGVPDEMVKKAVVLGICKVNFATELRAAYTSALRSALKDEKLFDPKACGKPAISAVSALVKQKMLLCGCANKA